MADVVEFLTSKELIMVYIVIGVVCFLCLLVFLIDRSYYKRKRKQNTRELNKLVDTTTNAINDKVEELPLTENILYVEPTKKSELKETETIKLVKQEAIEIEDKRIEMMPVIEPLVVSNIEPISIEIETKQEEIKSEIIEPEDKVENLVLDSMPIEQNEELQYTDIEPNPIEAQAELKRLTEELQKAQEVTKNICLTSLEEEQEANAIISLDELMKKSQERHFESTVEQYEDDDENKPISIEELEKMRNSIVESVPTIEPIDENSPVASVINTIEENAIEIIETPEEEIHQEKMILDEFNNIKLEEPKPIYQETRKFKSSPVISPVYGIENKIPTDTQLELENTANYEKLDEEIKKTNEFLMTLKELQKKLD